MNRQHGFTLIELLVSMSLLSMVVLVGASAFSFFGTHWDGRLGNFDRTLRNARNVMLVQDVLDSLIPYVAYDRAGKPIIYFEGNRNGFVAVSSKSLYSHGDFAVVRFSVRQNEMASFDLIYEEWPMDQKLLVSIGEPLPFSPPLTLYRGISDPTFGYYGWPDIAERSNLDGKNLPPPRWSASYNGVTAGFSPLRVNVNFVTLNGQYRIVSTLATQKQGMLSRYQNVSSRAYEPTLESASDDDCAC